MDNQDNLLSTLETLFRWKKTIRNVCLLTLVVAIGGSLLMDNYYQSSTTFYPASPDLASAEMIFGGTGMQIEYFGTDRELDRMTEIANSNELVDFLIKKFNLYEHYKMDSTTAKGKDKMRQMVAGLYSAQQNKYDAIEISVEDTDPEQAAAMANAAREKVAEISRRLSKTSQKKILETFDQNLKNKQAELKIYADSLAKLQKHYGIYETEAVGKYLSDEFNTNESRITKYKAALEVLDNNPYIKRDTIEFIKANLLAAQRQRQRLIGGGELSKFTEGLPKVYVIKDLHSQARHQLSFDAERYLQMKAAFETDPPVLQIIQPAEVPLVKSRPKRSLIVIGAVIAAFVFTLLAALLADNYRNVDWQKIRGRQRM